MLDRRTILTASLLAGLWLTASLPSRAAGGGAQITVDAAERVAGIGDHQIGLNLGTWYNVTSPSLPRQLASLAPTIVRWPGGSIADTYHWRDHTGCGQRGHKPSPAYEPHSTFESFMKRIVIPGHYGAAITVAYGTNATCTGGGDPAEAAAWVAYVKQHGYNRYIHHWTVGNEVFGGWEVDWHQPAHDAATYAAAMAGPDGYYQQMKAADPTAQIGVVVSPGAWDTIVLARARYDFVELHWYAQAPGKESDSWLLEHGPAALTDQITTVRQELQAAGRGATPIMLGEVNSVAYQPGKQTMSIVNALFTGMALGEVLQHNVAITTWWFGAGGTQQCNKDKTGKLYGWQEFGGYDLVAANAAFGWNYCTNNNGPKIVPEGVRFPSGNAFAMVQQFARPGGSMLAVTVDPSLTDVRAYAASQASGYALLLFNLSQTDTRTAAVALKNAASASFTATTLTYGKQQYDESRRNLWPGPVRARLGRVPTSLSVTLPPWSLTLLELQAR